MPKDNNLIVEIGPGLGDLTEKLLQKNKLVAYEIDTDLCKILKEKFDIELICGDVLDSWQSGKLREEKYNLIANLPYYVATNIILKALNDENCENILVLIQKEVAEKFSALCGAGRFGFDFDVKIPLTKSIIDEESFNANVKALKEEKSFEKAIEAIKSADAIKFSSYITNEEVVILNKIKEKLDK